MKCSTYIDRYSKTIVQIRKQIQRKCTCKMNNKKRRAMARGPNLTASGVVQVKGLH